jgi:hypothetical protein
MIARDTKVTHEEASRLYTRLMVKIQHNQLAVNKCHYGEAESWCIGGREIKDALMAIAEEDGENDKQGSV